jgi:hypothetical protein
MKIIGLAGPAGSGKSTIARTLRYRHGFIEQSFAYYLRDFILWVSGLSLDDLEQQKEDPHSLLCGKSPRYAMQTLGTEWGRNLIGPDLWVNLLARRIDVWPARSLPPGLVISDVRFENEADWVRERGELWHLQRPGIPVQSHSSESGVAITDRDVVVDNDCDLATLDARIAGLLGGRGD